MKVVILAGGLGSRLGTMTEYIPKPMVNVGENPIIWHIMKNMSMQGLNEFVIALGYKGEVIRNYFYNYSAQTKDFTIDLSNQSLTLHEESQEDWKVTCVNTGLTAQKGARIKKISRFLTDDINILTYGDGLADIDINALIDFHKKHNKLMTVTGVYPPSLFGEIEENNNQVTSFVEKSQMTKGLINGGFMVFDRRIVERLSDSDDCDLEIGLMEELAAEGEIMVYKHLGRWYCMDQRRDHQHLNDLWRDKKAFWKNW